MVWCRWCLCLDGRRLPLYIAKALCGVPFALMLGLVGVCWRLWALVGVCWRLLAFVGMDRSLWVLLVMILG